MKKGKEQGLMGNRVLILKQYIKPRVCVRTSEPKVRWFEFVWFVV